MVEDIWRFYLDEMIDDGNEEMIRKYGDELKRVMIRFYQLTDYTDRYGQISIFRLWEFFPGVCEQIDEEFGSHGITKFVYENLMYIDFEYSRYSLNKLMERIRSDGLGINDVEMIVNGYPDYTENTRWLKKEILLDMEEFIDGLVSGNWKNYLDRKNKLIDEEYKELVRMVKQRKEEEEFKRKFDKVNGGLFG